MEFSPLIYMFKNLYREETRAELTDVKISANEIAPYSVEEIEGSRSYYRPGTEFLRLHASTAGERLAGNAGRKIEIVFDTRTGSGLPAECARIENDDREALRCGIDQSRDRRVPRRRPATS